MLFFISTPEYNTLQSNTTKVKVHLRNGIAQIFDQHDDLMGKIDNNIVEIETNFENRLEKTLFVLQEGVFIVSNKGLDKSPEARRGTGVYIYAKRAREIPPTVSLEEISKQYEKKNLEVEVATQKIAVKASDRPTKGRLAILEEEAEFLRKVVAVVKDLKS